MSDEELQAKIEELEKNSGLTESLKLKDEIQFYAVPAMEATQAEEARGCNVCSLRLLCDIFLSGLLSGTVFGCLCPDLISEVIAKPGCSPGATV